MIEQHRQQLKWLLLQPDAPAMLGEFATPKIGFENPKLQTLESLCGLRHGKPARDED
ncbi:hypothetical protein [Bradyrhizobium sp.]|uniref:hypothetical protein n=1 Tax=Bradyrhizobium sp. TaxID=376 RepID=UPI003BB07BC9